VSAECTCDILSDKVAAKFMVEDDEEQMKEELKEAFRIYDKEVSGSKMLSAKQNLPIHFDMTGQIFIWTRIGSNYI
jgi:hypothetical protein